MKKLEAFCKEGAARALNAARSGPLVDQRPSRTEALIALEMRGVAVTWAGHMLLDLAEAMDDTAAIPGGDVVSAREALTQWAGKLREAAAVVGVKR